MARSSNDLYDQAIGLVSTLDENFLELGALLRELQSTDPEKFRLFAQHSGLGQRKAYYLITIDRTFRNIPANKKRLLKIGWTKLIVLSRYIDKKNYNELLKLAEQYTTKELEQVLRGEEPVTNARAVLCYFEPGDYDILEKALLKFGAEKVGRGLNNKELAMVRMARYALRQKQKEGAR